MAVGDGLVSMTPSSIAHSGTSASINSDGGVDFTAVTSLSLNGVFTSDYEHYLITCNTDATPTGGNVTFRLRAAGTDASGSNYTRQTLSVATSVSSLRATSALGYVTFVSGAQLSGFQFYLYGPSLAQTTAMRSVSASDDGNAYMLEIVTLHNVGTAYDGITFGIDANDITGTLHVFGYEE